MHVVSARRPGRSPWRSGIQSDPNNLDDPQYILRLLRQAVTAEDWLGEAAMPSSPSLEIERQDRPGKFLTQEHAMTDLVGQTFVDRYLLTRSLGREGMFAVYLARDEDSSQSVVLKILDARSGESIQTAFRQDIRPLLRLEHAHINPICDFDRHEQWLFMVQNHAAQGSLRQHYPYGSKLSLTLVLNYIRQIADTLQYAHDHHIVHGNLKPEAILVDDRNRLLLSDFRMAHLTELASADEELMQVDAGPYTAPELRAGQPEPASDQYALAAMVYEWLYGKPPLQSATQPIQPAQDEDPDKQGWQAAVPMALEQVLLKALSAEPAQRFNSVQEFASMVEMACDTRSVRVFFSYAQRDQSLCDQLENHLSVLKYRKLITTWSARKIKAGEDSQQQIEVALSTAHIILLLISAHFLASDYCYSQEMMQAIRRHQRGEAHVIPVLLRPVLYTDTPFAHLKLLPSNQKPVVTWRNRDSAFVDIAIGIERIAQERIDEYFNQVPIAGQQQSAVDTPIKPFPGNPTSPWQQQSAPMEPYSEIPTSPQQQSQWQWSPWQPEPSPQGMQRPESFLPPSYTRYSTSLLARIRQMALAACSPLWSTLSQQSRRQKRVQQMAEQRQREQALQREQRALLRREEAEQRRRQREEARRRDIEASGLSEQEYDYYERALNAYQDALDRDVADDTAWRGWGHALAALKYFEGALLAFKQAQQLTPRSGTYVSIGDILATLERWDEATAAYQQALTLDASSASAYAGLGHALSHLGQTQEAEKAYEQARQLGLEDWPQEIQRKETNE